VGGLGGASARQHHHARRQSRVGDNAADLGFQGETVSFVHTFAGDFTGSPLQSESTLQFCSEPKLRELLEQSGFVIEAEFGDFAGAHFAPSSPEIVVVARRR
jgi:hypothetical protein